MNITLNFLYFYISSFVSHTPRKWRSSFGDGDEQPELISYSFNNIVDQYGWKSWTTAAKVGTLVYITCFYGLLATLAWVTCLKGIIAGNRMTESKEEGGGENLATVHHHVGNEEQDRGRNSKLREVNHVDHQEMKEMTARASGTVSSKTGSSSSAPIVSGLSSHHPGLRSSLRNKNSDPKLKGLSKKGEVNVAFSSDP